MLLIHPNYMPKSESVDLYIHVPVLFMASCRGTNYPPPTFFCKVIQEMSEYGGQATKQNI
jgi:hypothetical protein